MKKTMNLAKMSYNDLVAGYNELIAKSYEYLKAIHTKSEEVKEVVSAYKAAMANLGFSEDEMKTILNSAESIKPVIPQEVKDLNEDVSLLEVKEDSVVEPNALPEHQEENKVETKTTSVFDLPVFKEPYNPLETKKSETPIASEKILVEKAVELAKTLPVADGINVNEPYFVTYDFAVSKKGELTQETDTFGRNESVDNLKKIKAENKGNAKSLHATDMISTEDCTAYMWYGGKNITVNFYSIPIKDSTTIESEESLPTIESLLSDDPEYKAFYHPVTRKKKDNRRLPTLDELLSDEPINKILCLGNEEPKGKAYRQHTRINHVGGIIPTETATGKTGIYIPPTPPMAA